MNIIVFGAAGLLGGAIVRELEQRGHHVIRSTRRGGHGPVDFSQPPGVHGFRAAVRGADVVVNAVGILAERQGDRWDRVHREATEALAAACQAERVARIVHVSALGTGCGLPGGYLASKLAAEQALARYEVDYAILRPALLADASCPSTRLFRRLASLPVIALPGLARPGASLVSPIQVADVAQVAAAVLEHPKALRRTIELAGPEVLPYRSMLARLRAGQGRGPALWLPVPWWAMKLAALAAGLLPQKLFTLDTLRMLQAGCIPQHNEAPRWLRRQPLPAVPLASGHAPASAPA